VRWHDHGSGNFWRQFHGEPGAKAADRAESGDCLLQSAAEREHFRRRSPQIRNFHLPPICKGVTRQAVVRKIVTLGGLCLMMIGSAAQAAVTLSVTPGAVNFSYMQGAILPAAQTVTVKLSSGTVRRIPPQ